MKNPLLDKDFLKQLDLNNQKEVYAKIVSLNQNELPLETIEGKVSQGSLSIDGDSAVRRSCSLTIIPEDVNVDDFYWGLSNKFKLAIGLKNTINDQYPDIIWFPQGIYVISSFKTYLSTTGFNIYISGKDKMCLLNGDVGGHFPHTTKLNVEEIDGVEAEDELTIKQIIKEMIHKFGNEPFHNIIINDVDEDGLELLDFKGKNYIYLFRNKATSAYEQILFDGDVTWYTATGNVPVKISELGEGYYSLSKDATNFSAIDVKADTTTLNPDVYNVVKCGYGEAVGYRKTPLIWGGKNDNNALIAEPGDTITSILDKIIQRFGEYEYFYDINGRFIFQKKLTYLRTSWNNQITHEDDETYMESAKQVSQFAYNFTDNTLITAFSNEPNFNNVRNDFSIWGKKKSVTGEKDKIDIHLRYAIDEKPNFYRNYDGRVFATYDAINFEKTQNDEGVSEDWWDLKEWAEYYKEYTGEYPDGMIGEYCTQGGDTIDLMGIFGEATREDLAQTYQGTYKSYANITSRYDNWDARQIYIFDVTKDGHLGYTGHGTGCSHLYSYFMELYEYGGRAYIYKPKFPSSTATGVNLDWREIIYQMSVDYLQHNHDDDFEVQIARNNPQFKNGKTGYEQYYVDINGFWRLLYDPYSTDSETYYVGELSEEEKEYRGWNRNITEDPSALIFWFDFLDPQDGQMGRYSVPAIGDRTKVVNNDDVKVITYKEVPSIIYGTDKIYEQYTNDKTLDDNTGHTYVYLPEVFNEYFDIMAQGRSAQEELDELMYQHTCGNESVSITTIPIYHLEPNVKVYIKDESSKIEGEYIINKMNVQLNYNSTMTISATRAPVRLY